MNGSKPEAGVDGCRGGWIAVIENAGERLEVLVAGDWATLVSQLPLGTEVGVDIPIGLPRRGPRQCDLIARRRLGRSRGSSVFPAPVRECLVEGTHRELSDVHRQTDGRGLSQQAYRLLPKIREVDRYLTADLSRQRWIHEVHPEVSFAAWNGGPPMAHRKSRTEGRAERCALIDAVWAGERERLWRAVCAQDCEHDDLNDACAALWTVRRIVAGKAIRLGEAGEWDERGLRMEIMV